MERLDKIVANQSGLSRSDARSAIRRGRVTADGVCTKDGAFLCDPAETAVTLDGQALCYRKNLYLLMNKPQGVLSASEDKNRKTVVDLVPESYRRKGLFPVGRLDRDTTGLLLITDDGEYAHRVISPKSGVAKTYEVLLDGEIPRDAVAVFAQGVVLADSTLCRPAKLEITGSCRARITLTEGKYHEIKRMFGTVGLGVNALKRLSIGALTLPQTLVEGDCTLLSEEEAQSVFL